ncbi:MULTISPECIES: SDR family NAD(P)-dependent oxidoreductase [unclassified Novosphingobium]|mgnify:CR=1 FL=1|uniref:SDR family NAD(P)-dependent oxidoreductase n=1 Tax=unclassified Novosphingobium TaxID=2644732 RepID=UPI00086D9C6D|nr:MULTISPECIES: SDR family NAD(P)-dependent oxidoreductase [unclassified Novosphingobium]MBN9144159.1 SDR family NAD(P)-dependent oxidoreductase [Novosphingobium sp.]MDR6708508.1 NAD(P)-dependent dehydrogenase (short-subunit alcohol dehydrogenase family) [Novosphingobium sp. 1748]ODU78322.1 MAG: oxidoreductase [Novosphingobium sp. SCN 63-17]OJX95022.1 MAG: oxidoreductase [Novosphingobium sp. 63-713]
MDLSGKIALVTGASRGIGAATAQALAAAGAHVIITGRDVKALEGVEQAIHEAGGTATIAPMDLLEHDAIARLAEAVAGRWGKLDVMVINAGILPTLMPVVDIDQKALGKAVSTHLLATQALLAAFDRLLRKSEAGRVIGLTTTVATQPRAYWGAYAATKAAQEVLLDCYAQEVANISSVRVAIVNPRATRTAMRAKAYPGEDPKSVKDPSVVADAVVGLVGQDFASPHRITIN